MPTYAYTGRDLQGNLVKGNFRADSEGAVAEHLNKNNISPVTIVLSSGLSSFSWEKFKKINIRLNRVTRSEMIVLTRNIGIMIDAGVPILQVIQELAKSSGVPSLKKALFVIGDAIQSGERLSVVLSRYPKLFSSLYVHTIEIGENTGNLGESFAKLSKYMEREDENSKRMKSVLRYPKFVLGSMVIAILIINAFVVPAFKKLFESFGAVLPLPTRILIATSNFITGYWYICIAVIVLIIILTRELLRKTAVRNEWDRLKLRIPIVGKLVKKIIVTRFFWAMSLMLRSGAPMIKSLNLVGDSLDNAYMKKRILEISKRVENGKTLSDSIREENFFNLVDIQMLIVGEESGNLDNMMEKIAVEYDKDADYELKRFADYIEPIMLLIIGGMVAVLALAVFLPMWDLGKVVIKH